MTRAINNDSQNDTFLPTRHAAELVGYTPDYVARLAREGKVSAEQRGRQWFVDKDSLKLFSLQAEAERRERQVQLREERLLEQQRERAAMTETMPPVTSAMPLAAVTETVAVFACLVMLGGLLWTSQVSALNMHALSIGAGDISHMLGGLFDFWTQETYVVETTPTKEAANGLVLLPESTSESDVAAVRESFSDEVNVEFDDTDTGIVTPVFREGAGDSYRFLLVPVTSTN